MVSKLYTDFAAMYAESVLNNIYNAHYERPSLQALIGNISGLKVLDLGCGSGVYTQYLLSKKARSVTCIDASSEMVALVEARFGSRVQAYRQDLELGLPRENTHSADVVICPLVLHYLEDITAFFAEVYRVLKPGGYMVFSTHHPCSEAEMHHATNYFETQLVSEHWNTVGTPIEVRFYRRSLTSIIQAITDNGLLVSALSEGQVDPIVENMCSKTYTKLSTKPAFIFIRCQK
jgi:2-polyprenyl-3-methyl-5-hydroxy-6-metoxy-1,4-benzoquinol methylase